MLENIKNHKIKNVFSVFSDARALGLLIFGIIILLVTWSGVKAVQTNFELQKQISGLEQQNKVGELQNQNQKLKNQYLNTDQFLELAARRQFGKAAPGETEILISQRAALAHTVNLPSPTVEIAKKPLVNRPSYQKNFQSWVDFFLHRPVVD
jgi:cell division protein FtsB